MLEEKSVVAINPQQAYQVISATVWPEIKNLTMAGHETFIQWGVRQLDRSKEQNKFYWGAVLREISQQASICGVSYAPEAWHELFRRQFLGYEIERIQVAGKKQKQIIRRLRSTTKLKVRAMSKYLEQVQAYAATELGVKFSAPDWMEWSERQTRHKVPGVVQRKTVIDVETGEIVDAE